jgi:hypothetical protein
MEMTAKPSAVYSHARNIETQEMLVRKSIADGNLRLRMAEFREGDRRSVALSCAAGMFGFAAWYAERAAVLQGHGFTLLPSRDHTIEEIAGGDLVRGEAA